MNLLTKLKEASGLELRKTLKDPRKSAEAVNNWPVEKVRKYFDRLSEAVTRPKGGIHWLAGDACEYAGEYWHDEFFNPIAEDLVREVTRCADWSYKAGLNWSDERFNRFREAIAKGVVYGAGGKRAGAAATYWKDERYEPFKDPILDATANDPRGSFITTINMPESRFQEGIDKLLPALANKLGISPELLKPYLADEDRLHRTAFLLAAEDGMGGLLVSSFNPEEFKQILDAYKASVVTKGEALPVIKDEKGNILPKEWYFKPITSFVSQVIRPALRRGEAKKLIEDTLERSKEYIRPEVLREVQIPFGGINFFS